ncbi:MAG: RDD family protein [Gammaproteobacteria bacterium]
MKPSARQQVDVRRSPLWRRLAAVSYDALLLSAVLLSFTFVIVLARAGRAVSPGSLWYLALLLGVCFFYFTWSWVHGGQTLGMRAWRLVLMRCGGGRVSWPQASLRFFAALLSWASLGLGFLWCVVDRKRLCWHDRASKTLLVTLEGRGT